ECAQDHGKPEGVAHTLRAARSNRRPSQVQDLTRGEEKGSSEEKIGALSANDSLSSPRVTGWLNPQHPSPPFDSRGPALAEGRQEPSAGGRRPSDRSGEPFSL